MSKEKTTDNARRSVVDWLALTNDDRESVMRFHDDELAVIDVTPRGQVYLRRHPQRPR